MINSWMINIEPKLNRHGMNFIFLERVLLSFPFMITSHLIKHMSV